MEKQIHLWLGILATITIGAGPVQRLDTGDTTTAKVAVSDDTTRTTVRGNDIFIDEDGDGICDGRARGLGLRRSESNGRKRGDGAGQHRWRGRLR